MSFTIEAKPVVQYHAADMKHVRTWVPQYTKTIDGATYVELRQTDRPLAVLLGLSHEGKAKYWSKSCILEDLRKARNTRVDEVLLAHLHACNPCEKPPALPDGFNRMAVNPDDLPYVTSVALTCNEGATFNMKMTVELMPLRVPCVELTVENLTWLQKVATASALQPTPVKPLKRKRPEDRIELPTPEAKFDYRRKSIFLQCKDADGRKHLQYQKPKTMELADIETAIETLTGDILKRGWTVYDGNADDDDGGGDIPQLESQE